jgi:DegV family protein with EDD domain
MRRIARREIREKEGVLQMVKIISDSTCDLSQELINRYNITILPLHILLGEQEYLDGVNITPDDIYRWSDEHKTTPKTSAVSMEDAMNTMKPYLEQGEELICFSISAQMSTTGNVLRLAAEELEAEDRVTVINSENLSTGIGLLVIEAAILAKEGKSRSEIAERIEELKPLVRASFVVDTLTYLYRGGRCSGVAAMAGSMLKLHPKIVVKDGEMGADKKYRGKLSNVILTYAKEMETDLLQAKKERVFITHSGCEESVIQSVYDYLESLHYFDEIHITRAGGVVSSHCGWGTLGVLFIAKENKEIG